MRHIKIILENKEFSALNKFKKKLSWRDFILLMYTHCSDSNKRGEFEVFEMSANQ